MSVALDLLKASTLKNGSLALIASAELESTRTGPSTSAETVPLFWPELESVLPDHGLPRGVVEVAAPHGLGGPTRVALAAVRGGQARSAGAWCAWLDPDGSLYAPGLAKAAVDLPRLLVVRPPRKNLAEVAVKLAQSRAFEVIVVDYASLPLTTSSRAPAASARGRTKAVHPEVLVRKLALLAEEGGSTIVMLTDKNAPRPIPWPVALRLELSRVSSGLQVKVAKDRFCRLSTSKIAWSSRPRASVPGPVLVPAPPHSYESLAAAAE